MKYRVLVVDGDDKKCKTFSLCLGMTKQFEVIALIRQKENESLKYSRFIDKVILHQYAEAELADFIKQTCIGHKIDLVFGLAIDAIDFLITYKSVIEGPARVQSLPDRSVFDLMNDKGSLAVFLEEKGIRAPARMTFDDDVNTLTYPLIIKPKNGQGGKGIFQCNTPEEFRSTLDKINRDDCIIQEFIKGYDIDLSLLAKDGKILAYTIQRGIEESQYHEFSPCAAIEFSHNEKLYNLVSEFIRETNFSGVGHLDLRYDEAKDDFVIIEINTRYWDSLIGSFVVAEINFPYLHAMATLGNPVEFNSFKTGVYITATAYVDFKMKRLKLNNYREKINFSHSGMRGYLNDPLYFIKSNLSRMFVR
ncbi:MAG TPA: ATP-grasp domain-containing protein [Ohtaekwangia sp.]